MPLVESGPPQWVWERSAERLKWEITPTQRPEGTEYELRVNCGLEILRLQFLTSDEVRDLCNLLEGTEMSGVEATARGESGAPGGGAGRADRTGVIRKGVRVDPDLTEGHPGYEESGGSGIKPR
jgi:hypothetical protein